MGKKGKQKRDSAKDLPIRQVSVELDFQEEQVRLNFPEEPPSEVGRQLRVHNFNYARKGKYWWLFINPTTWDRLREALKGIMQINTKNLLF